MASSLRSQARFQTTSLSESHHGDLSMERHRPRIKLTELQLAIVITAVLIALSPPSSAADPPRRSPSSAKVPEFAEMLWAILRDGADMGPDSGWFHPSESRYEWSWLAARFDRSKDGVVTADELKGSA